MKVEYVYYLCYYVLKLTGCISHEKGSITVNDREISKELNTISNLNGWGILGLLFPIIGVICYGIARGRAKKLFTFLNSSQENSYGKEVKKRIVAANVMLFICILWGCFWVLTVITVLDIKREASDVNNRLLTQCEDKAFKNYTNEWNDKTAILESKNNKLPADLADHLNKDLADQKNECRTIYDRNKK